MKHYKLRYCVYVEVDAETEIDAKFEGADLLSESQVPMEWYLEDTTEEYEIEEEGR